MNRHVEAQHRAFGPDLGLGPQASEGRIIGNWPDPLIEEGQQTRR